jgi:hypothetical protein
VALSRPKQGFEFPMGHIIPNALSQRRCIVCAGFIFIECRAQGQKPIRPGLAFEVNNPLSTNTVGLREEKGLAHDFSYSELDET